MTHVQQTKLVAPYGGALVNTIASGDERQKLIEASARMPSIQLSTRAACDLELLATGAFSPLTQFMGQPDYERVIHEMRLSDGMLFPIPITLAVAPGSVPPGTTAVALRNARNDLLAVQEIAEQFSYDARTEARLVAGTIDPRHPLVAEMRSWGRVCISGPLKVVDVPHAYDFATLRHTPEHVRALLEALGHERVVAFQTRNPLHRIHEELTKRAAAEIDGSLLIHPAVGMTKPGDVDHYTRVRTYRALVERYYDRSRTLLSLLPLAMRMAGPREALWHAIIRRNYGATHFIVGRDHASPGNDSAGKPFYGPLDAHELLAQHAAEIGVTPMLFRELVYLVDEQTYVDIAQVPAGARVASISGTQVRDEYLAKQRVLPAWFTRPETAAILAHAYPSRAQQGFCVWFAENNAPETAATAAALGSLLLERGRQSTLIDDEITQTYFSTGCGVSDANSAKTLLPVGFIARECVRHHGIAICTVASAARDTCRHMIAADQFIEVKMASPCAHTATHPANGAAHSASDDQSAPPAITLTISDTTALANAAQIVGWLEARGFLRPPHDGA